MAITRQKKETIVSKVADALSNAGSVVFVKFKGLPVKDTTEMRRKLRAAGAGYTVAKKTLVKRALADKNYAGDMPALDGEIAIAYGEDLIAPAREVNEFAKTRKEQLSIVGGVFEGRYMSASEMTAIATIPSRQVLIGQFVNLINSPIQRMAVVVSEIAKKKEA